MGLLSWLKEPEHVEPKDLGHLKAVARFYIPMLERASGYPNMLHCLRMCKQIQDFSDIHKANRWVGFIQGAMWDHGLRQIEDFRRDISGNSSE